MDRVNWTIHECLTAAHELRLAGRDPNVAPEQLHGRTRARIDAMLRDARHAGYGDDEVRAMAYALVALLDELAMAAPGPLRDYWSGRLLQLAYFGENVAGESFFTELSRARRDPERVDVVHVFYLALLFGFRGKYRASEGDDMLPDLLEELADELSLRLPVPERLSPDLYPESERVQIRDTGLPRGWLAACLALLAVVAYLFACVQLRARSEQLVELIRGLPGV